MLDAHTRNQITAFYGDPSEISSQIAESAIGKAILLVPPKDLPDDVANALQDLLLETAHLFFKEAADDVSKRRDMLIAALMPSIPAAVVKQASMEARARAAVLTSSDWLTAKDIAERAGLSTANASSTPWKWKQDGSIFAINNEGRNLFPIYGLDPDSGYRPLKSLKSIIEVFKGRKESWGMAYWFASANSFLGGKRPMDLIKSEPSHVLAAAEDEVAGVVHG